VHVRHSSKLPRYQPPHQRKKIKIITQSLTNSTAGACIIRVAGDSFLTMVITLTCLTMSHVRWQKHRHENNVMLVENLTWNQLKQLNGHTFSTLRAISSLDMCSPDPPDGLILFLGFHLPAVRGAYTRANELAIWFFLSFRSFQLVLVNSTSFFKARFLNCRSNIVNSTKLWIRNFDGIRTFNPSSSRFSDKNVLAFSYRENKPYIGQSCYSYDDNPLTGIGTSSYERFVLLFDFVDVSFAIHDVHDLYSSKYICNLK